MRAVSRAAGPRFVPPALRSRSPSAGVANFSRLLPPSGAGVARRWRFRRNVVIFVAHMNGIPQRELAEVFDLPQSRVSAIVREIINKLKNDPVSNSPTLPSGGSEG